jgi:hypothetical protein
MAIPRKSALRAAVKQSKKPNRLGTLIPLQAPENSQFPASVK